MLNTTDQWRDPDTAEDKAARGVLAVDPTEKLRHCPQGCAEFGQCKAAMHGIPSQCPAKFAALSVKTCASTEEPSPYIGENGEVRIAVPEDDDSVPASHVFDELTAFADSSEVKPTFADAVRIALSHKQRNAGVRGGHDTGPCGWNECPWPNCKCYPDDESGTLTLPLTTSQMPP